jgi:DnaK suppressor protein
MEPQEARKRLLAEQADLMQSVGLAGQDGQQDRAAETTEGGQGWGDNAQPLTTEYEDDAIASQLSDRLAQVGRALRRIDEGTWGRSVRSGVPIPAERLEADPAAELTVAEVAEQERAAGS